MKMLFENQTENNPLLSIILLDWSCRESFHFLYYINHQVIAREQYEVIWIEFYDREASEIKTWLRKCGEMNKPPVIDKWIVLEMPRGYYYHKHFMYNLGVLYSSGKIIVICDSDGIVKPTFLQSIIEEFSQDPDIVLHLDQLRNMNRKYYPYNYPSIAEIESGSVNLVKGKPLGLVDTSDTLHNRNYGACFCAKRNDIIAIGGADEHLDYLGHICGPYDLTFRLVNTGKKEKWHPSEWMYHVWHPGQSGDKNFVGPHDGRNMSTRALDSIKTKRIWPLSENEFIKKLRCKVPFYELTDFTIPNEKMKQWKIDFRKVLQSVIPNYDHDIALYSLAATEKTSSPDISVILPTVRPDKARKCIESIAAASEGVNYEVVVISPLDLSDLLIGCRGYHRTKFVQEEGKKGCCQAYTNGYEKAAGKYVFAIADDHRLGKDCLKSMIEFMQPHDEEIFLAGARCYGVYGPGSECRTYGFYYAFNPCIRRNLIAQVGGFYDPYYKHYYGDPDLSMRVWHYGGKVELCPDAWVEYHNELDDVDQESQINNAQRDFHAFFRRWHHIYGHLAASDRERDINIGNNHILPGIPPEKCTRLVMSLRKQDWSNLSNELDREDNFPVNKDHLYPVFKEMMTFITFVPRDIIQDLSQWLIKQLLQQTILPEKDAAGIFVSGKFLKINCNPDSANLFLAITTMFYLSGGLKRGLELVIDNYKGVNILYGLRNFFTWPCSLGGFNFNIFDETSDDLAFCESMICQAFRKIDEQRGDAPLVDGQKVRFIEEYFISDGNVVQDSRQLRQVIKKMPDEICLQLVLNLRLRNWINIEHILSEVKENTFIIKDHIGYVYGELLNNIDIVPPVLVVKLSQWILGQVEAFLPQTKTQFKIMDDNIRLVVFGYREYNIIQYQGLYYGWPWVAGEFSAEKYKNGIYPAAAAGKSIAEVKIFIDEKLGPPAAEDQKA